MKNHCKHFSKKKKRWVVWKLILILQNQQLFWATFQGNTVPTAVFEASKQISKAVYKAVGETNADKHI